MYVEQFTALYCQGLGGFSRLREMFSLINQVKFWKEPQQNLHLNVKYFHLLTIVLLEDTLEIEVMIPFVLKETKFARPPYSRIMVHLKIPLDICL